MYTWLIPAIVTVAAVLIAWLAYRSKLAAARAEIDAFVAGIADGSLGEGQVGAFALATFLRGVTAAGNAV